MAKPRSTTGPRASVFEDQLIGREREAEELARLIARAPIITVRGPVGVGKSRLVREVLRSSLAVGPRPLLCELSAADSWPALHDVLSSALGTSAAGLEAVLAERPRFVVLDGFDIDNAAEPLERLIHAAPACRWLITSRRALGLEGETVLELFPLELSGEDSAAVRCFIHLARAGRPSFQPRDEELGYIAELVKELDGLPLALELAAARISVMGPKLLLHRLRQSRGNSNVASADAVEMALGSALQAISPSAQLALLGLAVFRGGATLTAAESVLASSPGANPTDDYQSLCAASLVQRDDGPDGEPRLSVMNCVRSVVLRRADPELLRELTTRHASYFADQLEQREGARDRASWLASERDNLIAAVESVLTTARPSASQAEPALRVLSLSFETLWEFAPATLATLVEPVLEVTRPSGAQPLLVLRALFLRAVLRTLQGENGAALSDLDRVIHQAGALSARELQNRAELQLARVLCSEGMLAEAQPILERALAASVELGQRQLEAECLEMLGALCGRLANLDAARAYLERAIAAFSALELAEASAAARETLVRVVLDLLGAEAAQKELALLSAPGEPLPAPQLLDAMLSHERRELDRAHLGYTEAAAVARRCGDSAHEALALAYLALLCTERGRLGEAYAVLRGAFEASPHDSFAGRRRLFEEFARWLDSLLPLPRPGHSTGSTIGAAEAALAQLSADADSLARVWPTLEQEAARSFCVRCVARAVEQERERRAHTQWPANALVVGDGGRWFRPPNSELIDLSRRRPLARLLERLAKARNDTPGSGLHWQELLQAGWDEQVQAEAGAHRVRVAISTLRKLGLSELLKTNDSGYLLEPSCELLTGT